MNDKNPKTTNPMAKDECERSPSSASPAKFVVFCNLNKINATNDETANIDSEMFISNDIDNITPNNAECASVSPKNESLRHTTKHPRGPVTRAIPIPAISALNKKSSKIVILLLSRCYHLSHEHDHVHVHREKEAEMIFLQKVLYILCFEQQLLAFLSNKHAH